MELLAGSGSGSAPRVFEESHFRHLLSLEVERCIRYQDFLCLCLVRIRPEHLAGPAPWLRDAVAQKLAEFFRATDIVGMIGSEVGAMLLHTSDTDAGSVIERVRERVEAFSFLAPAGGAPVRVQLETSAGSFPGDATTSALLLSRTQVRFRPLS